MALHINENFIYKKDSILDFLVKIISLSSMNKTNLKMKSVLFVLLPFIFSQPQLAVADSFEKVAKILEENCVKCHGEEKDKGDLRLDTLAYSIKGGESGASVVKGHPEKSELLFRVMLDADDDDIMPPKGDPLSKKEVGLLETWIKEGANWPKERVLKAPVEKKKVVDPSSIVFERVHSDLEDEDFFKDEVYPVIEKHCYKCHGHEPETMKADFWMASRMNIVKGGSLGPVLDLENPKKSLFLELIYGMDEDRLMPPKTTLTEREKGILTEWVYRGVPFAKDLEHVYVPQNEVNDENRKFWSFVPVVNKEPGAVKDKAWSKNTIDQYILTQLESQNMVPSKQADKTTLIKRLYYTLTGLPPSPEEIKSFVESSDSQAYQKVIDRLLESNHYGEKWGRHWLDLVRYAETNGYERDGAKPEAYKYRQWVIDAFNQDKPYDRMIEEQLAGDELDSVTKETVTATGYYRMHIWDDEPVDREQAIYDDFDDVLKTTSDVFIGLTVGCARCHDHKIDPIPQKDYYRMMSFFKNIKPYNRSSVVRNMADESLKNKYEEENKELRKKRAGLQVKLKELQVEFLKVLSLNPQVSDMKDMKFKFYRDTWDNLPDFTMLKAEEEGELSHNYFDISNASRKSSFGYVFEGKITVPATGYYDFRMRSDDGARLTINNQVVIDHDGIHGIHELKSGRAHLAEGELDIKLEYFQKEQDHGLVLGWSGRGQFSYRSLTLPKGENLITDVEKLMTKQKGHVLTTLPIVKAKLGKAKANEINHIYQQLHKFKDKFVKDMVLCVEELGPNPTPMNVFGRGSVHAKGPIVEPAFLSILPKVTPNIKAKKSTSGRRKALAEWIANKDHPLTARVMVNRIWQYHFGRGLVHSSSNFGFMGTKPTHPELLDHLAHVFMHEYDWSIKKMHKYILMSSAYRMSSKSNEAYLAIDPQNDNFWRFNMQRLPAEDIRDSILKVTGKLMTNYGGASVYPKISQEVLEGQSRVTWNVSKKNDPAHQYRRTVYTYTKRSLVLPFIEGMDGPTTDTSCSVRFVTTQPTQSLTMLNSEFLRQASKDFVANVKSKGLKSNKEQIKYVWNQVTGRHASDKTIQEGLSFFEEFMKSGASHDLALQQYCLIALNLNEFIYLD